MNVCLCVDIYVHSCTQVRLRVLYPAPQRSETETCRHLRDRVSFHALNGCQVGRTLPERRGNPPLPAVPHTLLYLQDL